MKKWIKEIGKNLKKEYPLLKAHWLKILFFIFYDFWFLSFPSRNILIYMYKAAEHNPIRDLIHENIPLITKYPIHASVQITYWVISCFILVFVPLLWKKCHENQIYAIKNLIFMFALFLIIYTIRSICNIITVIPDPKFYCQPGFDRPVPENTFGKSLYFYLNLFYF